MEVSGRKEDWAQPQSDVSKKANQIYCDPCEHDGHHLVADGYCVDCKEYLCSACYSVHRRPSVWRHHKLQDAQTMPKNKPATKVKDTCTDVCQKHAEKIIEYFCNEHETFGCSVCMTTGHRACVKIDYIPDVAATFDTSMELTELQINLEDLIKSNEKNKADIVTKSKAVDIQEKRAKAHIKNLRTEVNELFDRLEKDIDKSVDDIKSSDETKMTKLANDTETISDDLQNCISEIQRKIKKQQMCQLFIAKKRMKESISKIAEEIKSVAENDSINKYQFEPDPMIVDITQKLAAIGSLKILDERAMVAEFDDDINVKSNDEYECCKITGIEWLSENQLAVVDNSNRSIKLVDVDQKELTSIYKTGKELAEKPFDVTKVEDDQIAVTYPNSGKIRFLRISMDNVLNFERAVVSTGMCRGIACSGNNLIVSFMGPPVVKILSMNGRVTKTIKGNFKYPDYVAVNPLRSVIYISNWDVQFGSLTCVTSEGKVNVIGEGDAFIGSRGIVFDKAGSVFVCCRHTNFILQLSEDCQVKQVLLRKSNGITNPNCIVKSEQNTLYIGMDGDKIKIFKIY